jgi:hypothetical protein
MAHLKYITVHAFGTSVVKAVMTVVPAEGGANGRAEATASLPPRGLLLLLLLREGSGSLANAKNSSTCETQSTKACGGEILEWRDSWWARYVEDEVLQLSGVCK